MAQLAPIRRAESDPNLLLRELEHRCANDLQLVVSSLQLQARQAASAEVREALRSAADRIAMLAHARNGFRQRQPSLECALQMVCAALSVQAEPRSILVSLKFEIGPRMLPEAQVTALMLIVNELATNAIKHAFGDGGGRVTVTALKHGDRHLAIAIEDDGCELLEGVVGGATAGSGMGLDLARRFTDSIGCLLLFPQPRSKRFTILVPLDG